ncbi:hypothetical protein GW17_00059052 [Ensete ventricosum]|nr:hypothetical protein GW17_00059052 [Ensete ventricosum]
MKGIFVILDERTVLEIFRIVKGIFKIMYTRTILEILKFKGTRSSFSEKDALTPLTPSASSLVPLRKRRLPLPDGSHPAKGRPPLLAAGLAAGGSPLRVPCNRPRLRALRCKLACPRAAAPASGVGLPCGLALAAADRPLAGDLDRGLAVDGRPCIRVGRSSSSLPSL